MIGCDLCEAGEKPDANGRHTVEVQLNELDFMQATVSCEILVSELKDGAVRTIECIRSQGRLHGHKLGIALSNMERTLRKCGIGGGS